MSYKRIDDPLMRLFDCHRQPLQHPVNARDDLIGFAGFEVRFHPPLLQQIAVSLRVPPDDVTEFLHLTQHRLAHPLAFFLPPRVRHLYA